MKTHEKVATAVRMRAAGTPYREIGEVLGVSTATAFAWTSTSAPVAMTFGASLPVLDGAACRGRAGLFDPAGAHEDRAAVRARHAAALELCEGCPVVVECRRYAEDEQARPGGRIHGVWGGVVFS